MAFALHRAAPAILASAATVVVGMLCLSFAELNSTAGLGPVLAVGVAVTFAGDGDPATGPARDLSAAGCSGRRVPTFGSDEPTSRGLWAKVGTRIASAPARRLGGHSRGCCCLACLGIFKLDASGLSTEDTYTKEFDSIKGQKALVEHGLAGQLQHRAGRRRHRPDRCGRRRAAERRRARRRQPAAARSATVAPTSRPRSARTSPRPRPSTSSRPAATAAHAVDGADALVGGGVSVLPGHQDRLGPRQQGDHPDRAGRGLPDPDRCSCAPCWHRCS